ncbi:hypothetical protein K439DRAFT_329154 [Ramaria rubella]|nr:hypothetical protein K439DRAFT_329154 [Ramaria rubella]
MCHCLNERMDDILQYGNCESSEKSHTRASCQGSFIVAGTGNQSRTEFGSIQCAHEFWVVLEIGEWHEPESKVSGWQTFTLRLSWPASTPVNFDIDLFKAFALHTDLHPVVQETGDWRQYARIRASNTGLRTLDGFATSHIPDPISFDLKLEPLLCGVLPHSVVPIGLLLLVTITVSIFAIPHVALRLSRTAKEASVEILQIQKQKL